MLEYITPDKAMDGARQWVDWAGLRDLALMLVNRHHHMRPDARDYSDAIRFVEAKAAHDGVEARLIEIHSAICAEIDTRAKALHRASELLVAR